MLYIQMYIKKRVHLVYIDEVCLKFSLLSNDTRCSESSTTSTFYGCLRAKTTSGASLPKASQFSMLFHQISLSPQHLELTSIEWRDPRELEAMEIITWFGEGKSRVSTRHVQGRYS